MIKAGKKTLAKVEGVKNLNKKHLEYSGGNTKTKTMTMTMTMMDMLITAQPR